ncbi:MAG: hypothetical protein K2Q01_01450 [Rickettsiales bacterium]|nr:hypothetical protein [Rickettsiales bacterium]
MGLFTHIAQEKDDHAFLDHIDPAKGAQALRNFQMVMGLELQNQVARSSEVGQQSGLDGVMGRLEDLRADDDHGSGVKARANAIWDAIFDVVGKLSTERTRITEGQSAALTLPPGMSSDPFPAAYERVMKDRGRYSEQQHRDSHRMRSFGLSGTPQVREDLALFAKMQEAVGKEEHPYYSLAVQHGGQLAEIHELLEGEKSLVKEHHQRNQITGHEPGASPALNRARREVIKREYPKGITPQALNQPPMPTDESSLLTRAEQETLRAADRIRRNLQDRTQPPGQDPNSIGR